MTTERNYQTNDVPRKDPVRSDSPPSITLFDLASKTYDVLGERHPRSLIVGTHPDIPLVGDGMLPSTKFQETDRTRIVDTPLEVLDRLRTLAHQNYRSFACVMAAFEFHHFRGRDRKDFIDLLQMMSHGTVIMADYSLSGVNKELVRKQATSRVEVIQQEIYRGFEPWLADHAVFTPESFLVSVGDSDWASSQGFTMPQNKVGMIASPTMSEHELEQIYKPSL